jgi:hypothetical protein
MIVSIPNSSKFIYLFFLGSGSHIWHTQTFDTSSIHVFMIEF